VVYKVRLWRELIACLLMVFYSVWRAGILEWMVCCVYWGAMIIKCIWQIPPGTQKGSGRGDAGTIAVLEGVVGNRWWPRNPSS
jgi:hypothetical protein